MVLSECVFLSLLPYLLLFSVLFLCFGLFGGRLSRIVFVLMCCWSLYESGLGLLQVLGCRDSGHSLFAMTGSFSNPGPYGGFLGITVAVAFCYVLRHWRTVTKMPPGKLLGHIPFLAAFSSCLLGMIVLPATMSRAGWLAFFAATAVFVITETTFRLFCRTHVVTTLIAGCVVIALMAGAFFMKKESALGRLHIWHIECAVIASHPLGVGLGKGLGAYGRAQETYFRSSERTEPEIRSAGCPEYAFNEYLGIGMETGVPGLSLSVLLPVLAFRNRLRSKSLAAEGIAAFCVFAFFSYPFSVWQLCLLGTVLFASAGAIIRNNHIAVAMSGALAVCLVATALILSPDIMIRRKAVKSWNQIKEYSTVDMCDDNVRELAPLESDLSDNYRFLYALGYAFYRTGRGEECVRVLENGASISSDPMFHNIMGECYEGMGDYASAEDEYWKSHFMVPCRIYPLTLLKALYSKQKREKDEAEIVEMIRGMKVNSKNRTMSILKEEALENE